MSKTKQHPTGLAESLVAYAKKQGAHEFEVSIQEGDTFTVNIREQEVERLTEAGDRQASLRVFVDGKQANASSSDLSEATMKRLIDNAIARARLGGADACNGLPEVSPVTVKAAELKIYDPAIPDMAPDVKIAFAKKVESLGLADKRIKKSTGASYESYDGTGYLANSKGFSGSYRSSYVSCYAGFQTGEGDNLLQDGWGETSTSLAGLPAAEAIAGKAAERVTRLIGARKVESQNVPLILEPPMTGSLLGFLTQCLTGASIDRKQSFLVDKLGERIGSDLVTVVDDGLMPGALGSAPFDPEGVPTRKTTVVEKGMLRSYLLNTYYGRKLKAASTGNAGGPTNLYLAAGTSTPEEIVRSVDKGLLLTGTIGLGRVPTTGDISVGAFGLWIEKGQIAFPVAEVTISGNLAEMLQGVQMVGNDLKFRNRITGPTVKIDKISVGGSSRS